MLGKKNEKGIFSGVEDNGARDAMQYLQQYAKHINLDADSSKAKEEFAEFIAQFYSQIISKERAQYAERYKYKGPTLAGFPFTSRYKFGDMVLFTPIEKVNIPAVVSGLIIIGPKVAYQLELFTGASVRTYGDRVNDFPEDMILEEEDRAFLIKLLKNIMPGL